ncbi:MAG: class I SAM-dependent methyltransferase [Anaerolineae bacterium]|nr:class I SAM-dependent methyltransferase [Anaerolineae bacterium]
MQAYGAAFARVYNQHWGGFARQLAPRIEALYAGTELGQREKSLLDVCCGTGQLARYFLERGYRVTGVDLSPAMLKYARENNRDHVASGQARFLRADASSFRLKESFGLAASTYDALNHLPDEEALAGCFRSVYDALLPGGTFIFDLNTEMGLRRHWGGISVTDNEEAMIVTRGIYDEAGRRALIRLSGFAPVGPRRYERFDEVVYNTAFPLERVAELLLEVGWRDAYFSSQADLLTPVEDPEAEMRVFAVARK